MVAILACGVQPAGAHAGGAIAGAPGWVAETDPADPAGETAVDGPETEGVMSVFVGILLVLALVGWLSLVAYLGSVAMEAADSPLPGVPLWVFGVCAALVFAIPLGGVMGYAWTNDPHANQLCVSGHEEWQDVPVLVGKVIVPQREKVWVCTQWESR